MLRLVGRGGEWIDLSFSCKSISRTFLLAKNTATCQSTFLVSNLKGDAQNMKCSRQKLGSCATYTDHQTSRKISSYTESIHRIVHKPPLYKSVYLLKDKIIFKVADL